MPPKSNKNQLLPPPPPPPPTSSSSSSQPQPPPIDPQRRTTTNSDQHIKKPKSKRIAIEQFAQAVHLIEGFADTLDAIPPSLTRSLSDLKELDAVLSGPLKQVHSNLDRLLDSLARPQSTHPDHRLKLLRSIVSDAEKFKLGAQDKIRVANGTCQSLSHHIRQLDTTTSLLISSLPPSLESRIPASSFPTGYPQLTGSLRSKPIGGVWNDSNSSSLPQHPPNSPPSMPARQFINFDHQPTASQDVDPTNPTGDPQPVSKRPKLVPTSSSIQLNNQLNPNHSDDPINRHQHQDHFVSDHQGSQSLGVSTSAKSVPANTLSRQNSLSDLAGAPLSINGVVTKNKRSRISSTSLDTDLTTDASHLATQSNSTSQSLNQTTIVGTKKRARKSQLPVGVMDKASDPLNQVSNDNPANPSEHNPSGFPGDTSPSTGTLKPTLTTNSFPSTAAQAKKTVANATRQSVGASHVTTGAPVAAPVPTKRAYTKRNGQTNGAASTSLAKTKRGNTKKSTAIGSVAETDLSSHSREPTTGRKAENQSRKGAAKESVRLEDVVESASKARARSRSHNPSHLADQVNHSKREKDSRKTLREPSENLMDESSTKRVGSGEDRIEANQDDSVIVVDEEPSDQVSLKSADSKLTAAPPIRTAISSSTRKRKEEDEGHPSRGRRRRRRRRVADDHDGIIDEHEEGHAVGELAEAQSVDSNHTSSSTSRSYCICDGQVYGDRMVACDNAYCPIEWFHYQCAGLTEDPTGNWFCRDCRTKGMDEGRSGEAEEVGTDLKTSRKDSNDPIGHKDAEKIISLSQEPTSVPPTKAKLEVSGDGRVDDSLKPTRSNLEHAKPSLTSSFSVPPNSNPDHGHPLRPSNSHSDQID